MEGKRGFPRIKPPFFPAAIGLYGQPTVVNNVETMSNLPWIVLNGGAAFAALGEGRSTGTRLFALAGKVNNPGVFELEMVKTTFNDLVNHPQLGADLPRALAQGLRTGGVSAPWFGPDEIDLPLGQDEVGAAGSMLGVGIDRGHGRRTPARCGRPGVSPSSSSANRAGSARPVAKVPVGSSGSWSASRPAGVGRRTSIFSSTPVTTSPRARLATAADHRSAFSAPRIPSSIASAIKMFRDEFLVHVKEEGCPYD